VPNEGFNSTVKSAIPKDTVLPPAVTGESVNVIPTGNTLNLTWNPSTAPDFEYYNVYMSTTSGFTPGPQNRVYSGNATFYLNDTLMFHAKIEDIFESVNTIEFKFYFENDNKQKVAKGNIQIGVL